LGTEPGVGGEVGLGGGGAAHPLEVVGRRDLERGRQLGVAGDAEQVDGVDVHVGCEPRCDRGGVAGEDVDHAAGDVGRRQALRERHRGQRALVGGDDDRGVAGDDDGRDRADEPQERGLLRREHGDHAGGLGGGEVEVRPGDRVGVADDLGQLVGPAGVPDQAVDRLVEHLLGTRARQALGLADGLHELRPPVLHDLGDAVEDLRAVVGRLAGPAAERLARRDDRVPGVLARGERGVGHEGPLRVVDDVGVARLRAREGAADEQLVGLADVDARHGHSPPFR
jgi:hypothetical protein